LNSLESGFFNSAINTTQIPASKPMSESITFVNGSASGFEREETLIRSGSPTATHDLYVAIDSEWQPE
jgi:hypothetical protein